MSDAAAVPLTEALTRRQGSRFLSLTFDDAIKYFFGGNAFVAVVVLALITIFLFKEGAGFFGQYRQSMQIYRKAGLEYVDFLRGESNRFTDLVRHLNAIRLTAVKRLLKDGKTLDEANAALAPFDEFSNNFSSIGSDLYGMVSDLGDAAVEAKKAAENRENKIEERKMLLRIGKPEEAAAIQTPEVDFAATRNLLRSVVDQTYDEMARGMTSKIESAVATLPPLPVPGLEKQLEHFREEALDYTKTFRVVRQKMAAWDAEKPVPIWRSLTSFLTGKEWLTASAWQDWYGVLPLFVGSLMVSVIALMIAVPLGVCAAIYVNQVAGVREQNLIKPSIEFIAAFPSVVLGFFGIVVLGEFLRKASEWAWLSWVPFFPIQERLNATTAGVLLGLMAVPTIFSLAEDAINNVPAAYKEASFALGASKLQTLVRIIIPASLSGIVAAILLGFGRVIGETMVVLLCAGNRIAIPDFSEGLGAMFQPVHTMTGIIAQEMGEVESGSIHYRALFVVAMSLFLLALLINYLAQKIVARFRVSIG